MKKVFINYTDYSNGEWIDIHYIGTDLKESIEKFKENLKQSLSSGPDDQHTFYLVEVNLKNKDYDRLLQVEQNESLYDSNIIEEFETNYKFKTICWDDHSGNLEILRMYCEDNNLDYDDDDIYQDVRDLLWNEENEELYNIYIDKYIKKTF